MDDETVTNQVESNRIESNQTVSPQNAFPPGSGLLAAAGVFPLSIIYLFFFQFFHDVTSEEKLLNTHIQLLRF